MRAALLSGVPVLVCLLSIASADEVVLVDGSTVTGKIMVRSESGPVLVQLETKGMSTVLPDQVQEVHSDDPSASYIRFHRYRDDWSRLEVLSRTFALEGSANVVLVGAVHVADLVYYQRLQRLLDRHDVVLFEGVGSDPVHDLDQYALPTAQQRTEQLASPLELNTLQESEVSASDPLTLLQTGMAGSLDLSFQRDGLDYSHTWWIPADATVEQLQQLYSDRDGSVLGELLDMNSNPELQKSSQRLIARTAAEAINSLVGPKSMQLVLKEAFADLLATQMTLFEGTAGEETAEGEEEAEGAGTAESEESLGLFQEVLIVGRNLIVMDRLNEVLQRTDVETIAIFYGAGHNADLEQRLTEMGFRGVRDEWIPAWNMEPNSEPR